jgi:hypothetical protein
MGSCFAKMRFPIPQRFVVERRGCRRLLNQCRQKSIRISARPSNTAKNATGGCTPKTRGTILVNRKNLIIRCRLICIPDPISCIRTCVAGLMLAVLGTPPRVNPFEKSFRRWIGCGRTALLGDCPVANYRNYRTYVKQREALKRRYEKEGLPCAACGGPFLWEYENRKLHPDVWKDARSFTADHIESVNSGGRMAPGVVGLRGMHRACNSSRGDETREQKPKPSNTPLRTSRKW